ncbi:MAG: CHAT domain-containing protein [Bacteroidetes bacterium]|nr:MAG: CHAT domain-containing protein [Bacteroidota bacterium]TAG88570.1 MAG: CHAT domain-containing protein [Bacteroidota bacterium]
MNYLKLKIFLLFFLTYFITFYAHAQLGDLLKNKKDDLIRKGKDKAKNKISAAFEKEMDKVRMGYDSANFSYSIAVVDNAGSFDDAKRWSDLGKFTIAMTDYIGTTRDKNEDPMQEGRNFNSTGSMFFASRHYKKAGYFFKEAEKSFIKHSGQNTLFYAQTLSNQALLAQALGKYPEAEKKHKAAMDIRKNIATEKSQAYATSLNNLGMFYKETGKYTEAESLLNQGLQTTENIAGKNQVPYCILLNNKAMLFQTLGRTSESIRMLEEVLKFAEPLMKEKSDNFQRFQVNLGLLYQESGKFQEAEKMYLDAIKAKERRLKGNHPDVAHIKNHLAALYVQQDKLAEAEKILLEAKKIYEKNKALETSYYASNLANLGTVYRLQDKLTDAEANLKEALKIRLATLGDMHPAYARNQEDLALVYWQMKKQKEAQDLFKSVLDKNNNFIKSYFPAMSEDEKAKYWNKLRPSYIRFYNFALAFKEQEPSLVNQMHEAHLSTKGILLNSTIKVKQQILNSGKPELIELYEKWTDTKENLAKLYSFSKEDLLAQGINRDSIQKVANEMEKQLSSSSNEFANAEEKTINFSQISNKIAEKEALVDILYLQKFDKKFTDDNFYIAFIGKKGQITPNIVVLENGNDLNGKYFKYYRNCIKNKIFDKHSYLQYWKNIDENLANINKVYLSLDGVYNQIGIATIPKAEGKYLVDEKAFVLLTNLKDLLNKKIAYTTKSLVMFGNPNYGNGGQIAALPGTQKEVDAINKIATTKGFKVIKTTDLKATESEVKKVKSPRILHVATHGFFQSDTENEKQTSFGLESDKTEENSLLKSGLLFANAEKGMTQQNSREFQTQDNGILTAYEVQNVDLSNTEFAILSACETGLGDVKAGEGVYGLQRAFQIAGANTIIMSLWTVSDEATQELMTLFYQNFLTSYNKVDAFKKAQQQLKTKYKEPYFWGAFVMVGN